MPNDDAHIEYVTSEIARLWKLQPELRLGQLIVNAVRPLDPCPEVFSVRDEVLLRKLTDLVDMLSGDRRG